MRTLKKGRFVTTHDKKTGIVVDMSNLEAVKVHIIDEQGLTIDEVEYSGLEIKAMENPPTRIAPKPKDEGS